MSAQRALEVIGDRIRAARLKRGWSQEQLAHEAKLDRSYLGRIERGECNVSFSTLYAIAQAVGTEVGELTRGLPEGAR